ncbi:MAG: hypothetical protein U0M02_02065 [Acutalibacteraceae bacterium]|nr:hypothetical protein [Acutalibacteraceae bacterium]
MGEKTLAKKLTEYQVNDDFDAAIYLLINHSTSGYYSSLDIEYHNYLDIGANKSLIQWLIINSVEKGEFISENKFTVECKSENALIKYEVSWPDSKNSFEIYEVETANRESIHLDSGLFIAGENIDYSERMKKTEEKIEQYKLAAFEAEQAPKKESYEKALQLLNEGKKAAAAIAFAKAEDYLDARERSFALWDEIAVRETVSASSHHTVGLKSDGTVVAVGYSYDGECDVSDWTNIVSVCAGTYHTVGLKSDGTVVAVGSNSYGQCDVSNWTDIVSVCAGTYHTVGIKSDGTVVAVGRNSDSKCDVSDWKDIVAVCASSYHTVGLKSDGTVVAVGDNNYDYFGQCDVSNWTDIVAVCAGYSHTIGLKSDGTVVAVGSNSDSKCDVSDWKDIVAVCAGYSYTVGIKSDGTVVAVGDNDYGQCGVSNWTDIVAVCAGYSHTVGIKSDGTVVAVGDNNNKGQLDISDWKNIKLP